MLRSRLVKNLLLAAAALLLGYAFVRFFLAQVGPGRSSELAAAIHGSRVRRAGRVAAASGVRRRGRLEV